MTPTDEATAQVVASKLATVLFTLPDGVILAASKAAERLLAGDQGELAGRRVREVVLSDASGKTGLQLLADGRLSGFEVRRIPRLPGAPRRTLTAWVKPLTGTAGISHAVATVEAAGVGSRDDEPDVPDVERGPVVGVLDEQLAVERVSGQVAETTGLRTEDLLGTPFFTWVTPSSVADLLWALAATSSSQAAVVVDSDLRHGKHGHQPVRILLLPLQPAPSCAFALLPAGRGGDASYDECLLQLRRAATASAAMSGLLPAQQRLLERLSEREREVVVLLLGGERVPAISQALFISQSTVRNHLSNVFHKLGVHSQQGLVRLVRDQS